MDLPPADGPQAPAVRLWAGLDKSWQEAFGQAWEALRSGNIAVGACAATPDGEIVRSARNRVTDTEGPPGEIFGSSLAHAETNVLARLPFRRHRGEGPMIDLVHALEDGGEAERLAAMEVDEALGYL